MNNRTEKLVGEVFDFLAGIARRAKEEKRDVVIWGIGRAGKYTRLLLEGYLDQKVRYIIDDGKLNGGINLPYDVNPVIYKSTLLQYLDPGKTIILSCIKNVEEIKKSMEHYGFSYVDGENLIDVRAVIGAGCLEYLSRKYDGVDFESVAKSDADVAYTEDMCEYLPVAHSCAFMLFDEIAKLSDHIVFFDYGCGKGGALTHAYLAGYDRIGGIEYSPELTQQCKKNMEILGIQADIVRGDAAEFTDIDNYNVFYFFNPFTGKLFDDAVGQIEASARRKSRKIWIVYGNPFCHRQLMNRGTFELFRQIPVDFYDPLLNIYALKEN